MPANTPNQNYPYPLQTDLIDVAQDLEDLAVAIDGDIHDAISSLDAKVSVSGDTMTGALTLPGDAPTSLNHATRKGYVDNQIDTCVPRNGTRPMSGFLDMDGHRIVNLAKPTADHNAARLQDVQGAMTDAVSKSSPGPGNQHMDSGLEALRFVINDDASPDGPRHATPKEYVDNLVVGFVKEDGTGGGMSADLNMNGNTVYNLETPPPNPNAAAPRDWVEARIDTRVEVNGDTMTGALHIGGQWDAEEPGATYRATGEIRSTLTATGSSMVLNRSGSANEAGGVYIAFMHDVDTPHGSIIIEDNTEGTPVTLGVEYLSASDYRIKENLGPITDAAERVQALGKLTFRGNSKGSTVNRYDLLNAHDIAEVAPYAVRGEKDAVGENGKPALQQVNYQALVPLLTAALGNALDRIDALEARLA